MPNLTSSSSTAQQSPAQVLSPEARKALRKALRDQLSVVQKKVRHMQAKRLLGVSDADAEADKPTRKTKGVEDAENDAPNPSLADRKDSRGSDSDRGKGDRNDSEEKGKAAEGNARGGEGLAEDLKSEAETFFSKGVKPKVGKTKSVFASIMSSEQRSFAQDHRKRPAQPTKKGGGGRKK